MSEMKVGIATYVTALSDRGEITGPLYQRLDNGRVVVDHLSSGSLVICTNARVASQDEIERMWKHVEWAEQLHESERGVIGELASTENDARAHSLLDMATARGLTIVEAGGFYKVSAGMRALYLSKNCRRVDLAGYSVEHPLLAPIDEATARWRRLGRVRAQALDIPADSLGSLWECCLDALVSG